MSKSSIAVLIQRKEAVARDGIMSRTRAHDIDLGSELIS